MSGYFNTGSDNQDEYPAMSHKPETWPNSWPHDYPGLPGTRDGLWNGEFGAYKRADQESYYVMDDRYNDEFGYYPFINSSIDSTGFPLGRRGIGLQVGVRGYQWVQVQAEDILIVRYDINGKKGNYVRHNDKTYVSSNNNYNNIQRLRFFDIINKSIGGVHFSL